MQVNYQTESNIQPKKYEIENILNNECDVIINDDIRKVEKNITDEKGNVKKEIIYVFNNYRKKVEYNENIENELKTKQGFTIWSEDFKKEAYELKAKEIRTKRDELLKETDKEMCLDRLELHIPERLDPATLLSGVKDFFEALKNVTNDEMAKYRQKLRDIPNQEGFPFNVEFPDIPKKKLGGM